MRIARRWGRSLILNPLLALLLGLMLIGAGCSSTGHKTGSPSLSDEPEFGTAEKRAEIYAHYATGLIEEINQRPQAAAHEFYQAASADPTNEEMVIEAAERLLQNKESEKALKLLDRAARVPEPSGLIYIFLGKAHQQRGNTNAALKASLNALRKMPDSIEPYEQLAPLYLQLGQKKEALQLLNDAAKRSGKSPAFALEIAELHLIHRRLFDPDTAAFKSQVASLLHPAAKDLPEDPLLQFRLAEAYAAIDENERAQEIYAGLYQNYAALPGLRERLTDLYLRTGRTQLAAELLEKYVREQPANPQVYYLLGHLASETKDYEKAADHFRKCILLNPENQAAYFDLAAMQIALNRPAEALETLEPIRARTPQNYLLEFYSALAHNRRKDYAQALTHLVAAEIIANATETNRLNSMLYFQLGATYERNKDYDQAEKYFHKCLALNANDVETLNYLGYMWVERGVKLEEALALIQKAVKLEPKNAAFLDSLAWALYKLRRYDEAMPFMLQAVELSPEPDATLFDHLGDIYATQKQMDKARDAWKKSLDLEANEEVKRKWESSAPHPQP